MSNGRIAWRLSGRWATRWIGKYSRGSGADVSDIGFYVAFVHFRFAVITQEVSARFNSGALGSQTGGNLEDDTPGLTVIRNLPIFDHLAKTAIDSPSIQGFV